VRGTDFSVYYNPSSVTTIVSSTLDPVLVAPINSKLPPVTISTDKEVLVTTTVESKVAPIGHAGAPPGGVDLATASALVLAVIGKNEISCGFQQRTTAAKLTLSRKLWLVSIRTTGRTHGFSTWTVSGRKVAPINKLAMTIASGCR
jgi:hypothetical protein